MIGIFNAGYSRSTGYVARVYKNEIHRYEVFCPKIIASIQPIPHTSWTAPLQSNSVD